MSDKPCPCEACKKRRFETAGYVHVPKVAPSSIANNCEDLVKSLKEINSFKDYRSTAGRTDLPLQQRSAYGNDRRQSENEKAIVPYVKNPTKKDGSSGGDDTEDDFLYFLRETIGIIGFCALMTFCLWALIMKLGLKVIAKINNSDKHVRNVAFVIVLIISLVMFQGMFLRKVKSMSHLKTSAVKIKSQNSKIIIASPATTKAYWYTLKDGVATRWIYFKDRSYKTKIRIIESWSDICSRTSGYWNISKEKVYQIQITVVDYAKKPFKNWSHTAVQTNLTTLWSTSKEKLYNVKIRVISTFKWPFENLTDYAVQSKTSNYLRACKETISRMRTKVMGLFTWTFGNRTDCAVQSKTSIYLRACKETISGIRSKVMGLFTWTFGNRSNCDIQPKTSSSWSFTKEKLYQMKTAIRGSLQWPFGKRGQIESQERPGLWTRCKDSAYKMKINVTGTIMRPFRTKSNTLCSCGKKTLHDPKEEKTFWSNLQSNSLSVCQKVKAAFSAPPEDPVAREVMRQSKLYAIPMEMKRPPHFLVCLRDYYQQ